MEISAGYIWVDSVAAIFGVVVVLYSTLITIRRRRKDGYLRLCLCSETTELFFQRLGEIEMLGREGQLRLEKAFKLAKKHRLDCGLLAQIIGRYLREMDEKFREQRINHRGYVWVAEEIARYYSNDQQTYSHFIYRLIPEYDPSDALRRAELHAEVELYLSPKRWEAREKAEKEEAEKRARLANKRARLTKRAEENGIKAFQPFYKTLIPHHTPKPAITVPPWLEKKEENLPSVV